MALKVDEVNIICSSKSENIKKLNELSGRWEKSL